VGAELVLKKHDSNTTAMQSGQSIALTHFDLAHDLEKKILDKIDPAVARVMAMTTEVLDPHKGLPATLNHINNTLVSTEKLLNGLNARAQDPRVDHLLTHLDEASASMVRNANLTEKTMHHTHQVLENTNHLVQNSNQTLQDFRSTALGRWLAPARAPQAAGSASK
jgi:ABC-type transporter Mla subunit MlaD